MHLFLQTIFNIVQSIQSNIVHNCWTEMAIIASAADVNDGILSYSSVIFVRLLKNCHIFHLAFPCWLATGTWSTWWNWNRALHLWISILQVVHSNVSLFQFKQNRIDSCQSQKIFGWLVNQKKLGRDSTDWDPIKCWQNSAWKCVAVANSSRWKITIKNRP